jgi:hypothetical protein
VSTPDAWELLITSTSRIALELALERLLERDAALLRAALVGERPSYPTVHLRGGELTGPRSLRDQWLPRCGALPELNVVDDPLAATCVRCKAIALLVQFRSGGQCWRMGCPNPVEEGKVGCAEHDALDAEEDP